MREELKKQITDLAGALRAPTFLVASEWILGRNNPTLVETGCFRGCDGDGQSTAIFALLAKESGGTFYSHELHHENIEKAKSLLDSIGVMESAKFVCGDSSLTLRDCPNHIDFAYLDSFDFEYSKPILSQSHQLVELGTLMPKMSIPGAFLLDDCDLPYGGKGGLSIQSLNRCGYKTITTAYQVFLVHD